MMLIVNNPHKVLESTAPDLSSQNSDQNKLLWLATLEKNNLYSSLGKFTAVTNDENQSALTESKDEVYSPLPFKNPNSQEDSASGSRTYSLDTPLDAKASIPSQSEINGSKIKSDGKLLSGLSTINTSNDITASDITATRTRSVLQQSLNKSSWKSSNIVVTTANNNVEVWVRDNSLNQTRTMALLKNVKDSMAKLGINLVKVAINSHVMLEK